MHHFRNSVPKNTGLNLEKPEVGKVVTRSGRSVYVVLAENSCEKMANGLDLTFPTLELAQEYADALA